MNIKNLFSIFLVTILFSSCSIFVDEYQSNQRKVVAYLLEDLFIRRKDKNTVLLGTGDAISGRIILESAYSPAENLIFYGNETPSTGWVLVSSKVSDEVTLVYTKNERYATINLTPSNTLAGFFSGDYGSDVVIEFSSSIANQTLFCILVIIYLPSIKNLSF